MNKQLEINKEDRLVRFEATNKKEASRPADIYLFKVSNGKTRTMYEIFSKLRPMAPDRRQQLCYRVFMFNLEQLCHIVLVFQSLMPAR